MRNFLLLTILLTTTTGFSFLSTDRLNFLETSNHEKNQETIEEYPKPNKIADSRSHIVTEQKFGNIPLSFVRNEGQFDSAVRYYSRAQDYTLWFTEEGLVFDKWIRVDGKEQAGKRKRHVSRLEFVGAGRNPFISGTDLQKHKINYFKGRDRSKWQSGVETYGTVCYEGLYKGIGLKVYGVGNRIEYDWEVAPGGDPKAIRFRYRGVKKTTITREGDLQVGTALGEVIHKKPAAYQEIRGKRIEVGAKFKRTGKNEYGFELGTYDKSQKLVIDPLIYSTYLGGSDREIGRGFAVDASGACYISGYTLSVDFPTTSGALDTTSNGSRDVFVTKLDAAGSSLLYSTYLGGSGDEAAYGLAVDGSGSVYLTGETTSSDYPVSIGAVQSVLSGTYDAFVTRLDAAGNGLIFSSYLGGNAHDYGKCITLDSGGNAYVSGETQSVDFPVTIGAFDTALNGSSDAFVAKINSSGSSLLYSTYLGGNSYDCVLAVTPDDRGGLYLAGYTQSSDFPVSAGAFGTVYNGGYFDGFAAKLNSSGSSLLYSTYLGGGDADLCADIAVDDSGNAYLTGYTRSTDFPVSAGAFDSTHNGNYDAFATKLNSSGSGLIYSSFLGGDALDTGAAIAVDNSGNAYLAGYTDSSTFPTNPGAFESVHNGTRDGFVTVFNPSGTALPYSSFLGGSDVDEALKISVEAKGVVYLMGDTDSSDFPTSYGAFDTAFNGQIDVSVLKITVTCTLSYDGNGHSSGTVPMDGASPYLRGDTVTVAGPGTLERDGYQFSGWNTAADGGGDSYSEGDSFSMPEHDVTLYAQWTVARHLITATVEGGHGSAQPAIQNVRTGGSAGIEFTPDSGYHLAELDDNGLVVDPVTSYRIDKVTVDHLVTARFANSAPQVRIIQPANGAAVSGMVEIRALAEDDGGIAGVEFFVDGVRSGSQKIRSTKSKNALSPAEESRKYLFNWDSSDAAAGNHTLRVTAFDEAGASASDTVMVNLVRISLGLTAERESARAWSFTRQYGQITLTVENPGIAVGSGKLLRKVSGGSWQAVGDVPASALSGGSWTFRDKYLEKDTAYVYMVECHDTSGTLLARSGEVTI